jgi:beta-glucanase (GH16 family)
MRRSVKALLAGALALCAAGGLMAVAPGQDQSGEPNPPPGLGLVPSFTEDFNGTALDTQRWATNFAGKPDADILQRTLSGNHEAQVYFDPRFLGLGIQPLSVSGGSLIITAAPLSDAALAATRAAVAGLSESQRNSPVKDVRYSSGMVSTRDRFSQTYGYFEMRARFPRGRGFWPAFWLLPKDGSWPPEIDIVEELGHEPTTIHSTLHSKVVPTNGKAISVSDSSSNFHRYGALWLPDRIDFYLDGVKSFTVPTPSDAHKPMYMVANLAVGGGWPGYPDASTKFPGQMEIDYIRAWSLPASATKPK